LLLSGPGILWYKTTHNITSQLPHICGSLQVNPQCWTSEHVLEWISDHVDRIKFDASTLTLDYCTMDGATLCQMNHDQMISIFGPQLGLHLHQSLQEHKTKYGGMFGFPNPSSPESRSTPRGTHLWEFIRDILIHPERNQGLMKWEDRREGIFKFLKSEAVAQMWGQKKKNSSMTYEKLSRAMRYYYKREILERVDGRRLVYKFGKNSSGWKTEEVGMGM
uniref:E74 like ETS transcription factor 3 n=1 Tax=Myripristis murdjan TaxID=586833 RepID=A0A667Z2S6_9TELE